MGWKYSIFIGIAIGPALIHGTKAPPLKMVIYNSFCNPRYNAFFRVYWKQGSSRSSYRTELSYRRASRLLLKSIALLEAVPSFVPALLYKVDIYTNFFIQVL